MTPRRLERSTPRRIGRVLPLVTLSAALLACPARADPPARAVAYVDVAALHALALDYFGPCQAGNLAAALREAADPACPPPTDRSRYTCLRGNNCAQPLIARLIGEAGRAKAASVDEFLARVNAGQMVRGTLVARNGGEHATEYVLRVEPDGRRALVARHLFEDGRAGTWSYPIDRR